jgi:transcriptional regulator with XRE-family HTH domain
VQVLADLLHEFMDARGLTQVDLAKAAKVSQSTVSRALRGIPDRRGRARKRLFEYAGITTIEASAIDARRRVLQAFEKMWNGSDTQAAAVAKVIDALRDVCAHVDEKSSR